MAVARKHHFFDYAAYRLRPADGTRTELVEGDFHVSPAPTLTHQVIVGELFRPFSAQLADAGVATVLMAPVDVILDEHNVVQPDLVVVSADRSAIGKARSPSFTGLEVALKPVFGRRF